MLRRHASIALALALASAATVIGQSTRTLSLKGVSVSSRGGEVVVTVSGLSTLPRPNVGVLQDPPRIYLDFANVIMGPVPREIVSTDKPVLRVRIGAHASPPTTRVVIDLATVQPYRLEMDAGSVILIVGRAVAVASATATTAASPSPEPAKLPAAPSPIGLTGTFSDIPRVPPLAAPPVDTRTSSNAATPSRPTPQPTPTETYAPIGPPPPAADVERYRKQFWGTLYRLRLQQPLLISLDAGEPQAADRMQMAVAEFDRLKQDVAAIRPSETMAAYHAMLLQATTMGQMAFTLRFDAFRTGDANTVRNASSAAAGAVLLLDRACSVIGCPPVPGRDGTIFR